jgi:GT2 family glycosyltransferase
MTKLSVFIVTYNSAALLRPCLDSLLLQNVPDTEIIVVDNASRDDTVDLVRGHYPAVKLIASDRNLGFGNANNLALQQADGDFIILLNPDATLAPNCLQQAVEHMQQNPGAGMGGGLLQAPNQAWQPSARQFPSLLNEFLVLSGLANRFPQSPFFGRSDRSWADSQQAAVVDWVPGAFAILRRDLIERIGLFDPRFFLYYEEVDLCRRIHQAGYKVHYWPDLVITHIGGASSQTVDALTFSSSGKQLTLWRMRSQLLYYRKWHGSFYSSLVMTLEQCWHRLRALRNASKSPTKSDESKNIVRLWQQAWLETDGGRISPEQPW